MMQILSAPLTEAIVLAGGFGTRLRSVVADVPKPMAQVAGRPFLEHVLTGLAQSGVQRCILSVGYLAEKIQAHFGRTFANMQIDYAVETTALGTGGGIFNALKMSQTPYVVVTNGDTLYRANLAAMHQCAVQNQADLVIAARAIDDCSRYGVILADSDTGLISAFKTGGVPGPGLINAGTYIARRDLLQAQAWPQVISFEQAVIPYCVEQKRAYRVEDNAYFIDIGIPQDYARAQIELL